MPEDPDIKVVGLEDEAAFEASMVFGDESGETGEATVILPGEQSGLEAADLAEGQPGWAGKTLGHFRLLRLIAEGSMGIVIQAMDINLKRIVALKVLRKRITGFDDRQRVDQFLREARAAARLDHPNVVRIYEINEHSGWWYIAMEMVEGGSVRQIIKSTGGMSPGRACSVIADAAVALSAAHSLGVIHRDVKPGNLMVSRRGQCKLTDFGLVRLYDPNDPFDFTTRAVGTPQFVAPEVIRQRNSEPASDVYSLGGTLYYALTGHPPYVGEKVAKILNQHLDAPPPELSQHIDHSPESLNKLVQWAMAKDPAKRPSAADFATALCSEAIDWRAADSGTMSWSASGSTVFGYSSPSGGGYDSHASAALKPVTTADAQPEESARSPRAWILGSCGAAAIVFLVVLALWMQFGRVNRETPIAGGEATDITMRFPKAPATYGVLPAGASGEAELPAGPAPSFSWVGKHDTKGLRFVASKRGRYYYPIDHADAQLIRSEDFVGYVSAAKARADGKTPAETAAN